jgi:hypothetical protein
MRGKNPMMPVRKAENRSGILLSSPGVNKATTPDTVMSVATKSNEIPTYQEIIFQFMTLH